MLRSTTILTFMLLTQSCAPESGEPPTALHPREVISAVTPQTTAGTDRVCQNTSNVLGYAALHFNATTVVPIFAKPDSSEQPVQVIRFYNDPATNSLGFRVEGEGTYAQLRPKWLKVDYFIFELSVLSRRGGWLEVVVDEETGKTLWLQENQTVVFRNWLTTLQKSYAVESYEPKVNPLRIKPAEDAKEVKMSGRNCFKVEQMRGNWIKVVQQDHCGESPVTPATGWIKWRDDASCMLVDIYPFA